MDGRGGATHDVNPRRGADHGNPAASARHPPHAAKVQVPLGTAHLHAGGKAEEGGGVGTGQDAGEIGDALDSVEINRPLAHGSGGAGCLVQALAETKHGFDTLAGEEAERVLWAAGGPFRLDDDLFLHRIARRRRGHREERQDETG